MNQQLGYFLNDIELSRLQAEAEKMYNGPISPYYLRRSLEVVEISLTKFGRVFAVRVDLRFAQDILAGDPDQPICFQRVDPQAITRFMESLKSQIREDHKRKGRRGEPAFPYCIWVREREDSKYPHYHLFLLFPKDVYGYLGDYSNPDGDSMAIRIKKAWCSALGLSFPDYEKLARFPEKPTYLFDKRSATIHTPTYRDFLLRLAYLSKLRTKDIGDGQRNFGCSQK